MSISTHFQDALDLVDPTAVLRFVVDPTYRSMEYGVSGLEIRGGSETGCETGAAALLDLLGFRFYAPPQRFWKLPSSIDQQASIPRRENWILSAATFLVYGHAWGGSKIASRRSLTAAYRRWATLVGVSRQTHPAGHRWKNIIGKSPAFFAANPQMLRFLRRGRRVPTFDLVGIAGTPDWDMLAEYCAAFMLDAGLNEFDRTHFDPVDSDDNPSDLVYPFSLDVVTRMRRGTGPIGRFPAQAGIPDAQIGVYAYAGHRLPPSKPYGPGVYTQVALAFNKTGLSYLDLIRRHGELASAIAIREYLDTQAWSNGRPLINGRAKAGSLERYDGYRAAGAVAVRSEFTANWLVNMPLARAHVLKFRTGAVNWGMVIREMTDDIFQGDPKVEELFTLWSDPGERWHRWSLRASFDIVDAMDEGWYKTYFKQLLTIHYQYLRTDDAATYGIIRAPGDPSDTFAAEISKLLSWATALRDDDILHSYALIRREANSALKDYPHLKFNAKPEPSWFADAVPPDDVDWRTAYDALVAETTRHPALDDDDLVLISVEPTVTRRDMRECRMYQSKEGRTRYVVLGPSAVTVEALSSGTKTVKIYSEGLHRLELGAGRRVSWRGGLVFMDTFPNVRKDPDPQRRNTWLYVPSFSAGKVDLRPGSRWSFYDGDADRKDWTPRIAFPDLGPGQVCVDNNNTRGNIANMNCNRYLSPHPEIALVSRKMATLEGKRNARIFQPE